MKTLRQLFAAIVLTLLVAVSSSAGDMHTTAPTPPPPSEPVTVQGNMHTGNSDEATASDAVAEAALSLLQGVLSLL
ncbi:MAG TPA: hypothetical protein VN282_24835 [Pyrinomonadaceae bacterium]|nr:hypothetical protein [Pyrinomonadaceae bacterium]